MDEDEEEKENVDICFVSDAASVSEEEEPKGNADALCAEPTALVEVDELPSEEPSISANDSEVEPERFACAVR